MNRRIIPLLIFVLTLAASADAQLYDVDVWVGELDLSGGGLAISKLTNLSNHPGYDNQPSFFPDGKSLLYTTEAGQMDDTGNALHAVLYDFRTGKATPLTEARGYSPTPAADGKGFMMLREGQVWLHDLSGKLIRPATQTKEAGYFLDFDAETFVLFMNDAERRIVIYDKKSSGLETMARGATTPLYRVPGKKAVTFVAEEPFVRPAAESPVKETQISLVLRQLDVKKRQVTTLATIPFATAGHHAWTPRGTLLIASGNTLYEWSPAKKDEFRPVFRSDNVEVQGITRIALSPKGDRIALVSTPRDETMIRNLRDASNAAIAAQQTERIASFYRADAAITAGNGQFVKGQEELKKTLADRFKSFPDLSYKRTSEKLEISSSEPLASEQGRWSGQWTTPRGVVSVNGSYMAMWRKEITDAGTPLWQIASEIFVTLSCEGEGCR